MQAWIFVIRYRDSRKTAGAALVALEARYVSVCWFNASRLDRRFASIEQWKEIQYAFSVGLPTKPLPSSDALPQVLLGDHGVDVQLQWLTSQDVEIDAPEHAVSLLDDVLIKHAAALKAATERAG